MGTTRRRALGKIKYRKESIVIGILIAVLFAALVYAICVALGILSLVLTGAQQLYAFMGVFVATGLVLLFLAWGGFTETALEADSYLNGDAPKAD